MNLVTPEIKYYFFSLSTLYCYMMVQKTEFIFFLIFFMYERYNIIMFFPNFCTWLMRENEGERGEGIGEGPEVRQRVYWIEKWARHKCRTVYLIRLSMLGWCWRLLRYIGGIRWGLLESQHNSLPFYIRF